MVRAAPVVGNCFFKGPAEDQLEEHETKVEYGKLPQPVRVQAEEIPGLPMIQLSRKMKDVADAGATGSVGASDEKFRCLRGRGAGARGAALGVCAWSTFVGHGLINLLFNEPG